ncbi:PilZ domain-containing protein [Undibacterium sp. SXout20W]|uniref:PilZ domain-containing protein n=1 Tax=Undibacterium sp. SXout20W TaxID=3413051 RepID=UPI003BEFD338
MNQPENRSCQRVQFFRLPKEQGFIPVWIFNRENDNALSALVVDMSENGMQVLTSFDDKLSKSHYLMRLSDDENYLMEMPVIHLTHVWSSADTGIHIRTGFSFQAIDRDTITLIIERMKARQQTYMRCVLTPVDAQE